MMSREEFEEAIRKEGGRWAQGRPYLIEIDQPSIALAYDVVLAICWRSGWRLKVAAPSRGSVAVHANLIPEDRTWPPTAKMPMPYANLYVGWDSIGAAATNDITVQGGLVHYAYFHPAKVGWVQAIHEATKWTCTRLLPAAPTPPTTSSTTPGSPGTTGPPPGLTTSSVTS